MKANGFVKEHGLQYIKSIIEQFPNHTHVTDDGRMFIDENTCCNHIKVQLNVLVKMDGLKRLVESHELVESHGGLYNSKGLVGHFKFIDCVHIIPDGLEQAIFDVESCQ